MSTEYCGKDWSEKPTYGELVAFKDLPTLINFLEGYDSFDATYSWVMVEATIEKYDGEKNRWWGILRLLHRDHRYLTNCPGCVQDWFNHLCDLTLLLEEG